MKFQRKTTYYPQVTYEFNLPAGTTCPGARDCKTVVKRATGKVARSGPVFRCYASASERFPGVRESRWNNYKSMLDMEEIVVPPKATHVRIHGSGDFFSQLYFDTWLEVCRKNPDVQFWAFTKSIIYWINSIDNIPSNLTLQASKGSIYDYLIDEHNLKFAEVFPSKENVPEGMPIDTDDSLAMSGDKSFALIDNFKKSRK